MEIFQINKDIKTFYMTATSFPAGVMEAHKKIHAKVASTDGRNFFGISYGDKNGGIIYKAAAEELFPGEAEEAGCETFIIPKGDYISETLHNWGKDETEVGRTFHKLLSDPRIDKNGFCLEMYLNETDMKCLVKLDSK